MPFNNLLRADISEYAGTKPVLDIQHFFTGSMKAWGIIQNRRGLIVQTVKIDMLGEWNGDDGILSEVLNYGDGRIEKRRWNLKKTAAQCFKGTAEGIIGTAFGESNGNAIRWNYVMTIPVGGKQYNVTFDDWMFAMDDDVMVNRSYMSKFGFKVAEISIFIQKTV